ncbi:MAG TPA: ATP-binding protein [Thermoanaerobaculia bacterium]
MSHDLEFIVYEASREVFRIPWRVKRLVIGRHPDADIRTQEPTMSARHAELTPVGSRVSIRDLDSLNGTLLNGVRVVESMLRPGDQVEIGLVRIEVSVPSYSATHVVATAAADVDGVASGQTVKVGLDQLRRERGEDLDEDERILNLRDLFEALKSADDRERSLAEVRLVLEQSFASARVFILRRGADGGWHDLDQLDQERRPSLTFTAEAARTQSAILSTSLPEDQRFSAANSVRISGIETAIAAPVSCDGAPVAVLYIDRLGLPPFDRRDLNLLGIAANHISAVLENILRFAELRRKNAELHEARERLAELNRHLEQRVRERTAELEERSAQILAQSDEIGRLAEAKDELLGIAAHDIRGPLTVIQGTIELLQLRVATLDEDTLRRSLDLVHESARGLSQLLSELLDAKAIEAGKVTLRRRPVAVEAIVEEALPVARLAAEDKRIVLDVDVEAGLEIEADPQRLGQAITNLLLNAVKFSKAGSRILLQSKARSRKEVEIVVEDHGVGIPKEELDRIFGTFEQGKAGKQIGGSGLGLMIARRVVELHGGSLSVLSEVGVGTRFVIAMPILAEDQAARPRRSRRWRPKPEPSASPSLRGDQEDESQPIGF